MATSTLSSPPSAYCPPRCLQTTGDILTLLWPSMACSSRSLITCGVAAAAVIAWRCRGSVRTDSRQQDPPRRRGGGGKPADAHRPDGRSCVGAAISSFHALICCFLSLSSRKCESRHRELKTLPRNQLLPLGGWQPPPPPPRPSHRAFL